MKKYSQKELDSKYKLDLNQIYQKIDPKIFNFKTTNEVQPSKSLERVIGQEEFYEPIMRALRINAPTYNVIMVGPPGCGKSLLTKVCYERIANEIKVENTDQFCWYNFVDDRRPHVGQCPAGTAKKLSVDLLNLTRDIENDILNYYEYLQKNQKYPEEIEKKKNEKIIQYENEKNENEKRILKRYQQEFDDIGYILKEIKGTKQIDFDLPMDNPKKEINVDGIILEKKSGTNFLTAVKDKEKRNELLNEFKNSKEKNQKEHEKTLEELLKKTEINYFQDIVKKKINVLKKNYNNIPDIIHMLNEFENDMMIPKYLERFIPSNDPMGESHAGGRGDQKYDEYQINILVDNSDNPNKPNFEYLENPTRETLFGTVIWEAFGNRGQKPHRLVRSGAMIKNNKGFVVIDEGKKIIYDPRNGSLQNELRDFLLTSLQNKKVKIGGGSSNSSHSCGVETEPVDADVSLILCANEDILPLLELNENQAFRRRFKVVLNMNYHMPNNLENQLKMARHYKDESLSENLLPATPKAIARVIEYQMIPYGKDRLTCQLDWIKDVYLRATDFAKKNKDKLICKKHIDYALKSIIEEKNGTQKRQRNAIKSGRVYINNEPEVGVVYGLVYTTSGIAFGYPNRNTFSIKHNHDKGLRMVNIEEKVDLSGSSFNKSFKQIQTYLSNRLNHLEDLINIDLIYSISQTDHNIDGPSAGGVLGLGFISAMSNLPVRANTFFTGQIEPKTGKILPVGGINEKVTGAYHACKDRNINDGIAVIPKTNIKDLQIIDEEMINDIQSGNFKIYSWENIKEGEEIAFGLDSETIDLKIKNNLKTLKKHNTKGTSKKDLLLKEQLKTLKTQQKYYELMLSKNS